MWFSNSGEHRIKTKPTRVAGWVGRNFGCSLPTRRRTHATTHSATVREAKHVARIEARLHAVNRSTAIIGLPSEFSCIAMAAARIFTFSDWFQSLVAEIHFNLRRR